MLLAYTPDAQDIARELALCGYAVVPLQSATQGYDALLYQNVDFSSIRHSDRPVLLVNTRHLTCAHAREILIRRAYEEL